MIEPQSTKCEKCGSLNLEQGVFEIQSTTIEYFGKPPSILKRLLARFRRIKGYSVVKCLDCGHIRQGDAYY
jgi:predicted nucleic-acid-binding Zn-ribbon protein